jgi:hypothetical protein
LFSPRCLATPARPRQSWHRRSHPLRLDACRRRRPCARLDALVESAMTIALYQCCPHVKPSTPTRFGVAPASPLSHAAVRRCARHRRSPQLCLAIGSRSDRPDRVGSESTGQAYRSTDLFHRRFLEKPLAFCSFTSLPSRSIKILVVRSFSLLPGFSARGPCLCFYTPSLVFYT